MKFVDWFDINNVHHLTALYYYHNNGQRFPNGFIPDHVSHVLDGIDKINELLAIKYLEKRMNSK